MSKEGKKGSREKVPRPAAAKARPDEDSVRAPNMATRRGVLAAGVLGGGALVVTALTGGFNRLLRYFGDEDDGSQQAAEGMDSDDIFVVPDYTLSDEEVDFPLPEGETLESLKAKFEIIQGELSASLKRENGDMAMGEIRMVLLKYWPSLNNAGTELEPLLKAINAHLEPLGCVLIIESYAGSVDRPGTYVPFCSIQTFSKARYAQLQIGSKQGKRVLVLDIDKNLLHPSESKKFNGEGGQVLPDGGNTVCMYPKNIKAVIEAIVGSSEAEGYKMDRYITPTMADDYYRDILGHELIHADDHTRFPTITKPGFGLQKTTRALTLTLDMGHGFEKTKLNLQGVIGSYTEVSAFGTQMAKARSKSPFNLFAILSSSPSDDKRFAIYEIINQILPYLVIKASPESKAWRALIAKQQRGETVLMRDFTDVVSDPEFTPACEQAVGRELFQLGRYALKALEGQVVAL